ncbi:glycosyltransferase family 4 protein [Candidatus Margulisiibacteriota bacterium]
MQNNTIFLISHQADLSGAPLSLMYLAKGLLASGKYHPVYIVPERGPLLQKLRANNIETIVLSGFKAWQLYSRIKKYNPSILHVNTAVNWYAAIIGRLCRIPVVWHIREDLSGHPWLISFIVKYADRIVAISRSVRSYFPQQAWPKIDIIYNAIDLTQYPLLSSESRFENIKDSFSNKSLADNEKINIGFAGSVEPRKGVLELIEAFSLLHEKFPQVRLHCAGRVLPVARKYYQKIEGFCKRKGLKDDVIWRGSVESIADFYREMDIVVVPSLSEPFGRVVIEAMAAGKPVIGSNCGGIPEIIKDGETGFLAEAGNSQNLAGVMIKVMNIDGRKIDVLVQKARADVEERFSLRQHTAALEQIYKREGLIR